ncbi:hypothetical protein L5515_013515 [Caenorhabditis briggsae]|uniref:Uncharacterized protein n=1 Tax=Caenorhabditis briggsae TaxID=6238 RepID=A0AAE9ITC6_CAEBR|nr:hypothetical protein L3Y34_017372 [Caenorhabditis briggsae]UMM16550.1 hypothetical protein L5515_013515 [Caenorhabditis briggsae]
MAFCKNPEKFFPVLTSPALRDGSFKGKLALVTGGGTGIGKAIASTLAHLGASVAIASRNMEKLQLTASDIQKNTGGICEPFEMNIRDPEMVSKAFDQIQKKFGKDPDVLVNNAAGNFIMATERLSANAYGTIIDIVLKGTMNVTTELGRRCIKNKAGAAITSITANYARAGGPFVVPSAISKAGVETMTKSLATEWSKYGLRFNAVSPGPIPTKGAFGRLFTGEMGDAEDLIRTRNPAGRSGTPEEVANLVAFVSSDHMSFLNGVIIDLDGGQQHMHHGSHMGEFLHEMDQKAWDETENLIRGRTGKEKL